MLRSIFVILIVLIGGFYAVQSPFYFLLFYLWYAYFRPDVWIYWLDWVQSLNLSFFIGAGLLISTVFSVPRIRINAAGGLMILFLLHSLLCTVVSAHPDVSWSFWWPFLRVWLVSYTIIVLVTDLRRYRLTLLVIAASLGFEAAKQGWADLILNAGAPNNNPLPFLGDNNGVAVGMMMLVPLFSALAQTSSRRWERIVYWIFGTGAFLRGVLTYSRGGFIAAIVLAVVYWLQSAHKVRTLASLALVGALVLVVMPKPFWDRMQTITAPSEERDQSARGRLYFWQVAMTMAAANPIVGVGFNGYEAAYNSYDTYKSEFGEDRAVHSTWFGVLAETGYVGFALFAGLFLLTLWNLFRISRRRAGQTPPEALLFAKAILTSLIAFGAGGAFVNLQYNEMLWHFVALGAALQFITAAAPAAEQSPAGQSIGAPSYGLLSNSR